ncbi:MAG: hypothetical protein V4721_16320 [Bacteroidota bacterium]
MEKWIVLILCLLALALICWKETQRKNRARLHLRITASVLAIVALYFLAQPVRFQRKLDPSKENTAVLLTEGFDRDSLSSLKNIPQYSADRSITANNKGVTFIPDLEHFSRSQADINKIHIVGSGLEQHDLNDVKDKKLIFHPNQVSGFQSVHWNSTVRSGEKLTVQGRFNSKSKDIKILLRGLSTTLDSIDLSGSQTFELSITPKLINTAIYSLIAVSGKDTLANEKIPVIIEAKTPVRVLMLSSSPDFEYKFLKSWLSSEQYTLLIRTAISKDKFSTEFLNTERLNLNRISPSLLKNIDVVIGDMAELSSLGGAENAAIQNELSNGMGLIIRADEEGGTGFYKRAFNIRQSRAIDQKSLSLTWDGRTAKKTAAPSGWGMEIVKRSGEQALVRDNQNHTLVSSKLYGAGRIIASTVSDSYTWMLSNNSADYFSYWSHIIGKAARKAEATESWAILNQFPTINSPAQLRLESSAATQPSVTVENIPVYFAQDPSQSYRWNAQYWPPQSGWQAIKSNNKESFWYAFDGQDWQSARMSQRIANTEKFIGNNKNISKQTNSVIRTYTYTLPAIYFFVLFLMACGYLWIERKLAPTY